MQASKRYRCDECGTRHRFHSDAAACCVMVSEVYVCSACKDWHDTEEEANECCTEKATPEEPNDAEIRAELEARGQLRLVE